jgi:hypothetical protein
MAKKKPVVFTFGRFQPPTTGHEKLIKRVIDHAEEIGGEHRIYTSQSSDANRPRAEIKDPLEYGIKVKFLKKMFPYANIVKGGEDIATFMRVLYELDKTGYKVVHMIVGDDRVAEVRKTVNQYLGGDDPETALNFDEFKVISAGKRDPDAVGVEGMSGSKLRAAVKANDFKLFKKGMPSGFADARGLFDALKKGLEPMKKGKKVEESVEQINEVTPPDEKSERFVKKAKASFKDRYGDDWASYLYGTAWKQYNKRHGKPTKTRLGEPVEVEESTRSQEVDHDDKQLNELSGDLLKKYIVAAQRDKRDARERGREIELELDTAPLGSKLRDPNTDAYYEVEKRVMDQYGRAKKRQRGQLRAFRLLGTPIGVKESTLNEGGIKASLEDWLEGLPKKVVSELKSQLGSELKKAHYGGYITATPTLRKKIERILVANKVKPLLGDKSHAEGVSAIIMSFWTFHGDNPSSIVRSWTAGGADDPDNKIGGFWESTTQEALHEGGMKAALEDFMYSIPKEAIEELKPVMQVKNLTKRFAMITKVLKKHGFTQRFMGSMPANVVNDYYPTFFGESVEQIDELTIPRKAEVVDRNKEEKTVTLKWADADGWHEVEVPEDEVPGFYDRAAEPLKARKTDRFGNIMNPPKKGAEKKTERAAVANVKNAEEILDIFDRKPMKTEITVYGKKWGKSDEYEMVIMKRMYQGEEVFVVKSSGRFVELRPTGAGLQVIDTKTKRILLDKGNDATW